MGVPYFLIYGCPLLPVRPLLFVKAPPVGKVWHHGLVTVTIAEHRGDVGGNGNPRILAIAGYRAMQRLGRK